MQIKISFSIAYKYFILRPLHKANFLKWTFTPRQHFHHWLGGNRKEQSGNKVEKWGKTTAKWQKVRQHPRACLLWLDGDPGISWSHGRTTEAALFLLCVSLFVPWTTSAYQILEELWPTITITSVAIFRTTTMTEKQQAQENTEYVDVSAVLYRL